MATAVLPVWRSPMISSRWPRPIGTSAVDRLEAGLHRLVHRLARNDAGRLDLDAAALGRGDRALAVDRIAEPVDHAAEQALADRHVDDGAGALDGVAFADGAVVAEDHDADIVALEVERHALDAAGELDHLAGLDVVEAIDAGDAVADREHLADLGDFGLGAEIGDLLLEDGGDFGGTDIHLGNPLHGKLQTLQLAADGRIEQARADLDDQAAEEARDRRARRWKPWCRPARERSASLSCWSWAGVSGTAEVTAAVVSPRRRASSARKAVAMADQLAGAAIGAPPRR